MNNYETKLLIMRKITFNVLKSVLMILVLSLVTNSRGQEVLAEWTPVGLVGGTGNYGPSPFPASIIADNIIVGGLTRGSGIGTAGSAVPACWGGRSFESNSAATAIIENEFVTFTITSEEDYVVSIQGIDKYNVRRPVDGPTKGQWQYQIGAGSFNNIGSESIWIKEGAGGNEQPAIDLSNIPELQNIPGGITITFRILIYGASKSTGRWYLNGHNSAKSKTLRIIGTVTKYPAIYENGAWSETPAIDRDVIIRDFLTVDGVNQGDFSAKTITLEEGGGIDIMENYSVTVEGAIVSNGNFTVRNGANLVQTDDVVNIGEITVLVNSTPMKRLDWTLWSSPVAGQNLYDFSPQTVTSRIYKYNPATDEYHNTGITSSSEFEEGVAFLFRAPNNYSPTVPTVFEGEFTGIPYNGTVEVDVVASAYNGLGNPYPSAIDTETFFDANPGVHSIYFWQNVPLNEDETGYDGPIYVVNTAAGSTIPSGLERIAVGQGFIAWIESGTNEIVFDNSMRRTQSGVFYKTMENEKHRLWLNLSQAEGNSINNILIAYMEGATNGFDDQIDGEFLGYYGTALYNIVEDSEALYAVQGRSLPFTDSDTVALGFRALEAGSYTISLANFDGLFVDGQNVFIKDNLTKTEQNLKDGDYTFVSDTGVFEDRFEVVYKPMGDLSVNNPQYDNKWVVYKQGNGFQIETQGFEMKEVMVYDMLGRTVYNSSAEGASHTISNIVNGVLIVKVITTDNQTLIRKTAK